MQLSRKVYLLAAVAIAIFVVIVLAYVQKSSESSDAASQALQEQNIDISSDSFISQIYAGNRENIQHFVTLGATGATQNWEDVSALLAAEEKGYSDIVHMLLATLPENPEQAKQALNLQDKNGKNLLIAALERHDKDFVAELLARGVDVAATNRLQESPLIIAVNYRYTDMLQMLIDADNAQHHPAYTVYTPDAAGNTPLFYAIQAQSVDMVKTLLGAHVDVNAVDPRGTTPLMVAAQEGHQAIAELLVKAGAKLDVADIFGETPLIIAIRQHHITLAMALLKMGANPDFHTIGPYALQVALETAPFDDSLFADLSKNTKVITVIGSPLLFDAINLKHPEIVKMLLDAGLSAKAVNDKGETALYDALDSGVEESALLLMEKGADTTQTGVIGVSLLEEAVKHNESKVVNKLLALGMSPTQKSSTGYTLAEIAVYSGYPEVLKALLDNGATVEKNFGILWAIRDGHGKAVGVLLDHGADPNVTNEAGEPALWLAASAGQEEAVKALIAHHAALDNPNRAQSMTPLSIAAHSGQFATVKLLTEAGAKLNAVDAYGMTPLMHAAYMTKPDIVEYLISKGANTLATDPKGRTAADLGSIASPSAARDKVLMLLQKK